MSDTDKIDTLEKAREMSLTKWVKVGRLTRELFDEINSLCGFCAYVDEQTGSRFSCSKCLVCDYCQKVQERTTELEQELLDEIDRVISFIKKVKAVDD